jgi:methyl-accepting chemotaxis protein
MIRNLRFGIGAKIYLLIGFCLLGSLVVGGLQIGELSRALRAQKQLELTHLGEIALDIVTEEYAASQKGLESADQAKTRAINRLRVLRYGQDGYFWINDMQPRMIMHPTKPEFDGKASVTLPIRTVRSFSSRMSRLLADRVRAFSSMSGPSPASTIPNRRSPS